MHGDGIFDGRGGGAVHGDLGEDEGLEGESGDVIAHCSSTVAIVARYLCIYSLLEDSRLVFNCTYKGAGPLY